MTLKSSLETRGIVRRPVRTMLLLTGFHNLLRQCMGLHTVQLPWHPLHGTLHPHPRHMGVVHTVRRTHYRLCCSRTYTRTVWEFIQCCATHHRVRCSRTLWASNRLWLRAERAAKLWLWAAELRIRAGGECRRRREEEQVWVGDGIGYGRSGGRSRCTRVGKRC